MGVWIEILYHYVRYLPINVTPCMGVWIEIALHAPVIMSTIVCLLYTSDAADDN